MKTLVSHSLEETAKVAAEWLGNISVKYEASNEAICIGLSGHLGAGKTAFVKEAAKQLGIEQDVTSPTFVIMKIYETKHPKWHRLIHIDAYRLEKREELEALRLEELITDPHNLIMIEWPENVGLADFKELCLLKFDIEEGNHVISVR